MCVYVNIIIVERVYQLLIMLEFRRDIIPTSVPVVLHLLLGVFILLVAYYIVQQTTLRSV